MADIDVERKERGRLWLWLLPILLIALLIWWFGWGNAPGGADALGTAIDVDTVGELAGDVAATDAALAPVVPAASVPGAPRAVNEYLAFVNDVRGQAEMGLDHEYTSEGLQLLADALAAAAEDDAAGATTAGTDSLRALAAALQEEPESMRHADMTRRAFQQAAALMQRMAPADDVLASDAVTRAAAAADAVQPAVALLEQRATVQRFFDAAGSALEPMVRMPAGTR